ncbi:MAG: cytochrome c biogenesis protein CcsA [Fimbriimonadaceae bacterium]|nr:cytochrome c biogenesis protein CcsA [Fimbriimonadaceae bacterium]QYK57117.1 MAG: cytochrome c biogenesis protein CcsA [Fimbriimonadaceae bacterium]
MTPEVRAVIAPQWSLVVGQIGYAAVFVALGAFLLASLLSLRGKPAAWAFTLGVLGLFTAFGCLLSLFVNDQFQFKYIAGHSALGMELKYKVAAVWSGQEGSILLWGTATAIFGLLASPATGRYRRWFTASYAALLAAICAILAYESPFVLLLVHGQPIIPPDGKGLAPSLLNYWVVIHPPTIFLGFGSLAVLFAWAFAALLEGDLAEWLAPVRPWAILSATLLGLGLAMGGFWAYETLGWGGFWMWDPVENTSFVPWCFTVAFIHNAFVTVARKKWAMTTVALAAAPLVTFIYGTFLTRSGFLGDTSVHSFAEMDRSALWTLIALMFVTTLVFATAWGWRARNLNRQEESLAKPESWLNREVFFGTSAWIMGAFGVVTAIGMSVPLFQSLAGQAPKVVDEKLYNSTLAFLYFPLIVAMAAGPFLSWRGIGLAKLMARLLNVLALTIFLTGVLMLWLKGFQLPHAWEALPASETATTRLLGLKVNHLSWSALVAGVTLFGIVASAWRLAETLPKKGLSVGGLLTHVGVLTAVLGLLVSRSLEQKEQMVLLPTRPMPAFGYQWQAGAPTVNYADRNNKVPVVATRAGDRFQVEPGLYYLGMNSGGEPQPMAWPGILSRPLYDFYVVVHDLTFDATDTTPMAKGETRLVRDENMLVTYEGLQREGEAGMPGAKFTAKVKVETPDGEWTAEPAIQLGEGEMIELPSAIGDKYRIRLRQIDAATGGASLQVQYQAPAYPVEVFYKPLTKLVWWGVGIMTLGGLAAAWARRPRSKSPAAPRPEETSAAIDPLEESENAPEPVAKS